MSEDQTLYEAMRKEIESLRTQNDILATRLGAKESMSPMMARIEALAKSMEKKLYEDGYRYEHNVLLYHEEGTILFFRSAFAVLYYDEQHGEWGACETPGQWLFVYTEHHGVHCYAIDDLYGYKLLDEVEVPKHATMELMESGKQAKELCEEDGGHMPDSPESGPGWV